VSWSIHIPHRSPEDPLVDVAEAAHVLPTDEARVVRQLVLGELVDGSAKSAGELLDKLEAASPEERRKMLDAAREAAGLERTEDIDFREQHAVVQRNACARAFGGPPPRLAHSGSGGIVDLAEQEQERKRAEAQGGITSPPACRARGRAGGRGGGVPASRARPRRGGAPRAATGFRRMSATAFERALDEMMFERLCRHEAGHLAAAILLGLDVVGADAKRTYLSSPPSDLDEAAGAVYYRRDPNDPDYPRKVALVSLLGPLHEGEPGWPPPWPLDPASTDDERS
jgi:hypothetical protein